MGQRGRADAREDARRAPERQGIRRIMEFDADPRALTLSDGFIEGVNLLEKFGWSLRHQPQLTRRWTSSASSCRAIRRRADDPRPLRQARHQAGRRSSSIREDMQDLAKHSEHLDQALRPAGLRRARTGPRRPAPLHRSDARHLRAGAHDLCRRLSDPAAGDDADRVGRGARQCLRRSRPQRDRNAQDLPRQRQRLLPARALGRQPMA